MDIQAKFVYLIKTLNDKGFAISFEQSNNLLSGHMVRLTTKKNNKEYSLCSNVPMDDNFYYAICTAIENLHYCIEIGIKKESLNNGF